MGTQPFPRHVHRAAGTDPGVNQCGSVRVKRIRTAWERFLETFSFTFYTGIGLILLLRTINLLLTTMVVLVALLAAMTLRRDEHGTTV